MAKKLILSKNIIFGMNWAQKAFFDKKMIRLS